MTGPLSNRGGKIVSLAEHRAAERTKYSEHLSRIREEIQSLTERLVDLKLLLAVAERLVDQDASLSDAELAGQIADIGA